MALGDLANVSGYEDDSVGGARGSCPCSLLLWPCGLVGQQTKAGPILLVCTIGKVYKGLI